MNSFELLGIQPPRLNLEAANLEKIFHELSRRWHPDHQGGSDESIQRSAEINGAYRRLRDPWKRAAYLLEIYKIPLGSKVPHCLAPTYFELQEADDQTALKELRLQLEKGQKIRAHQLEETFKAFDGLGVSSLNAPPSEEVSKVLHLVQELVLENNYAISMLRDLDKRLGPS